MYKEIFAQRMKEARRLTGFSQEEIAQETGINRSDISKYETGEKQAKVEQLGILATFYGVTSDWLIGIGPQKQQENTYR